MSSAKELSGFKVDQVETKQDQERDGILKPQQESSDGHGNGYLGTRPSEGNTEENITATTTQQTPQQTDMPDKDEHMTNLADNYYTNRSDHSDTVSDCDNDYIDVVDHYSNTHCDNMEDHIDHYSGDTSHDNESHDSKQQSDSSDSSIDGESTKDQKSCDKNSEGKSVINIKRRWRNLYANSQKSSSNSKMSQNDSDSNQSRSSQSGPPKKRVKDTLFLQITARRNMKNMKHSSNPQQIYTQDSEYRDVYHSDNSDDINVDIQERDPSHEPNLQQYHDQSQFGDAPKDFTDPITAARLEQSIKLLSGDIGLKFAHRQSTTVHPGHARRNQNVGSKMTHDPHSGCDRENVKPGMFDKEPQLPVLIPLDRFFNQNHPVDYSQKETRGDNEGSHRGDFINIPTATSPDKSDVSPNQMHDGQEDHKDKQQAINNLNKELSQLREDCSAAVKAFKRICQEEATKSKTSITEGNKKELAKCILKSLKHKMIHSLFDKVISLEYADENEEVPSRQYEETNETGEIHSDQNSVRSDDGDEESQKCENEPVEIEENDEDNETPSHDFHLKQLLFAQDGSLQERDISKMELTLRNEVSINSSNSKSIQGQIPSVQDHQLVYPNKNEGSLVELIDQNVPPLPEDCSVNVKRMESPRHNYGYENEPLALTSERKCSENENSKIAERNTPPILQPSVMDNNKAKEKVVPARVEDHFNVDDRDISIVPSYNVKTNSKQNNLKTESHHHSHSYKKISDIPEHQTPRKRAMPHTGKEAKSCKAEFNLYRQRFIITKSELDRIIQEVYAQDENTQS